MDERAKAGSARERRAREAAGTRSRRALVMAVGAAALRAPADRWPAHHDTLFAQQPPETSLGFRNDDLLNGARDIGGDGLADRVTGNQRCEQAERTKQAGAVAEKNGGHSTPWFTLNGRGLDQTAAFTPEGLRTAVRAAGD